MNKVVTGKVRFSYLYVFEPRATQTGDEKYSVTILIPKTDTVTYSNIMNAMQQAISENISNVFNGAAPANPKMPLYDGDGLRASGEPFGEECKGCWVITASSNDKPEAVDASLNPIMTRNELYSGCYGRVSLNFFAYNKNGNKGVGCGLMNIQKLEDGPSLTGRTTAAEDFADFGAVTAQPVQNNYSNQIPQFNAPQTAAQNPYGQAFQFGQTPQYGQQPAVNPITGEPIINNIMGVN